jgi:hypothetical protein
MCRVSIIRPEPVAVLVIKSWQMKFVLSLSVQTGNSYARTQWDGKPEDHYGDKIKEDQMGGHTRE